MHGVESLVWVSGFAPAQWDWREISRYLMSFRISSSFLSSGFTFAGSGLRSTLTELIDNVALPGSLGDPVEPPGSFPEPVGSEAFGAGATDGLPCWGSISLHGRSGLG